MEQRYELLPGVSLAAVRTDKFKTGCFSINFLRPLCVAEASMNALIPSVLLRGSEEYRGIREISAALDEMYGASVGTLIRKKGEVQAVGLYADYIDDDFAGGEPLFDEMLCFIAELLLHPLTENGAFFADFVESEKLNLENAIESRVNDKRYYAAYRLAEIMYENEACGVPRLGRTEDVRAVTAAKLYEHYRKVLATSRMEICYIGRKDGADVAAAMKKCLSALPREKVVPVGTEVVRAAGAVREKTECLDVTQGKLCMGFRTACTMADADYPALLVLNAVYGAGVTSKLFLNVREAKSLCYYASSALNKFKGTMSVSSGIEFDKVDEVKAEILRQLDDCREGKITESELASAKKQIISSDRARLDSPARMDEYYIGQAIAGLGDSEGGFAAAIEGVSAADCAAAAQKITLDTVYFLKGAEK